MAVHILISFLDAVNVLLTNLLLFAMLNFWKFFKLGVVIWKNWFLVLFSTQLLAKLPDQPVWKTVKSLYNIFQNKSFSTRKKSVVKSFHRKKIIVILGPSTMIFHRKIHISQKRLVIGIEHYTKTLSKISRWI